MIDRLREALARSDESLYAIAARAGVPRQSLARFVAGERGLTLETASAVARDLGLDLIPTRRRPARRS